MRSIWGLAARAVVTARIAKKRPRMTMPANLTPKDGFGAGSLASFAGTLTSMCIALFHIMSRPKIPLIAAQQQGGLFYLYGDNVSSAYLSISADLSGSSAMEYDIVHRKYLDRAGLRSGT